MARERGKCPPKGASKAYLVSFGDTMTALLAFFIVLNSLADEQTGANLHSGTGSFARALNLLGLPTHFTGDRSAQSGQLQHRSPQYIVGSENSEPGQTSGPDAVGENDRIVDREQEDWQRMLRDMRSIHSVQSEESEKADVTFDFFKRLGEEAPLLPAETRRAIDRLAPAFGIPDYDIEITVWATTPGTSAWTRAVMQAGAVADEIAVTYQLDQQQRGRLRGVGRVWHSSDQKRPVLSVTVRRTVRTE